MPATWKQSLDEIVARNANDVTALRRHLHENPETSGEELQTSLHLYQLLDKLGVDVRMGPDGCGVIADSSSADPPTERVAFRGDIDALSIQDEKQTSYRSKRDGVMHACGHDAHAAIAYGAVRVLAELESEQLLPWPISWRAIFQPAEETAQGATRLIQKGVLNGVNKLFSLHVDPTRRTGEIGLRSGAMTANCDAIHVTVVGRGGHAARPHESKDPIAAAAQLISTLYQFTPRATDSHDAVVLTFGKIEGGANPNVIPDRVSLEGTLRTLQASVRARAIEQIRQVIRGVEEITGTEISFELPVSIPSVHNDADQTRLIWQQAEEVVGAANVQLIARPSMGSEDLACYLLEVPGAMFRLGCSSDLAAITPLHTPHFDIDESALEIGVRILVRAVVMGCQPEGRSEVE